MSFYTEEYRRTDVTASEMLDILEAVQSENMTGIGAFYHEALQILISKLPNFVSNRDRLAVQNSVKIIFRGLVTEKYTAAAPEIYAMLLHYDVIHQQNDGFLMNEAFIALGEINAQDHVPHIVSHLEKFNSEHTPDLANRRKIQLAVTGAITALETLKAPEGVKPVFYVSIGWYDKDVRDFASAALPNIMEDPYQTISEIIQSPFNNAWVKTAAWQEMLRTRAPSSSMAKVAAVVLETSYNYYSATPEEQSVLRILRNNAIDAIRRMGVGDDSVYAYLERTYREAYNVSNTDSEVVQLIINTLSAVRTEEAVQLLTAFLRELHSRRRSGPWGITEREMMQKIIPAIAVTGTNDRVTMQLLATISHSSIYTGAEQSWAGSALRALVK